MLTLLYFVISLNLGRVLEVAAFSTPEVTVNICKILHCKYISNHTFIQPQAQNYVHTHIDVSKGTHLWKHDNFPTPLLEWLLRRKLLE